MKAKGTPSLGGSSSLRGYHLPQGPTLLLELLWEALWPSDPAQSSTFSIRHAGPEHPASVNSRGPEFSQLRSALARRAKELCPQLLNNSQHPGSGPGA